MILNKKDFLSSLYCRFDEESIPGRIRGKYKDLYVYFFDGSDNPITKEFIEKNGLSEQEIIEAAMPKKERVHISEYTGGVEPRPDQVVYEDKCGAAVLMLDEVVKDVAREQNVLLVPQGDMFLLVYRLGGTLDNRVKKRIVEVGKVFPRMYLYDMMAEEVRRVSVE